MTLKSRETIIANIDVVIDNHKVSKSEINLMDKVEYYLRI